MYISASTAKMIQRRRLWEWELGIALSIKSGIKQESLIAVIQKKMNQIPEQLRD
jgi:hypothetical protein